MLCKHGEVRAQHRDVEAGGANVDADQHAQAGMQLQVFGTPPAG